MADMHTSASVLINAVLVLLACALLLGFAALMWAALRDDVLAAGLLLMNGAIMVPATGLTQAAFSDLAGARLVIWLAGIAAAALLVWAACRAYRHASHCVEGQSCPFPEPRYPKGDSPCP